MSEEKIKADIKRMGEFYTKALDGGKFNADSTIQFNAELTGKSMSGRSTPETDDAQWGTGKVTTDFARKLERERDEARERERVAIKSWDEERQRAIRESDRVLEAIRERDEAREAEQNWRITASSLRSECENLHEIIRGEYPETIADALIRQAKEAAK